MLKIKYLNGRRLYSAFLAGGEAVIRDQAYLNKINVYPVPDADTGTNLASTMRAIAQGAEAGRSMKDTLRSIANAALFGAQGNSGIIFAQFLHGMSKEVPPDRRLSPKAFAESVKKAVQHAYNAIVHPVEGTMITVIREWAESVYQRRHETADFEELFAETLPDAHRSLRETTRRLAVLAKANVVDAGAKGFVDFLEGILHFIRKGRIARIEKSEAEWTSPEIKTPAKDKSLDQRYCTEALLTGTALDPESIRSIVRRYGESAVVAGSEERVRVHVHTNAPADLFYELKDRGTIAQIKVDDMRKQYEAAWTPKSKVAIVTDSPCDLPQALLDERQIHVLPMTLTFGDQQFLDGLTMTPDNFYKMLAASPVHPKTAQPPMKLVQNLLSYLATHYESIIFISISSGLTGVFSQARQAAAAMADKKITVLDSRAISAAEGLIVDRASELALAGYPHDEIVRQVESWIPRARLLVDVVTLKYFVRGGRVSAAKGLLAKLLNIKPIITLDAEGRATEAGKSFSEKANMAKILGMVKEAAERRRLWKYAVVHARNPEKAARYAEKLTALLGRPPAFVREIAPVIGAHSGIGAVAVAYLGE